MWSILGAVLQRLELSNWILMSCHRVCVNRYFLVLYRLRSAYTGNKNQQSISVGVCLCFVGVGVVVVVVCVCVSVGEGV